MQKILFSILLTLISFSIIKSQTLVASYPFPNYSQYNSFWGITKINDTLRIATDNNGSIYKVTTAGVILDSLTTPFTFNHGLVWDGTGYWLAEDFRSAGARLFKINTAGQRTDSIQLPSLIGGASGGVGGIALDGNGLWFSIYSPDFTTYPYAYAYKIDLTSRQITDTIPLRGRQVQGITVKGDTIIYVNDYFHTTPGPDPERIYAYRKATGDTLFSFPTPDPDGDCSPRGLHWDGQYLWLIADRIGNNMFLYRTLYKYTLTGAGNPQITTSTNSLDFGNTIIGSSSDRTLTITNTGTAKLIISNFNMTNPRFSILPNNVPDTINTSQTKNYTVSFSPNAFDTTSGQLRITSNDGATPVKIVSLRGKGIYNGSNILLSATNYDFGQRRNSSMSGWIFTITNTGSQLLNINLIQTFSNYFRLDTVGLSLPFTIDTQKTKQLRVWFRPQNGNQTYSDFIRIVSNAVNLPDARIDLSGSTAHINYLIGDIFWQGVVPDNPFTTLQNYKPVSIKQINDVNGDGVNEIIIASANYLATCFNGNSSVTSDVLWSFNTGTNNDNTGAVTYEDAMQIRNDIDADGYQDVVLGCGGGNEMVYTISGGTGRQIWAYGDSISFSDGDINGVRADKDYNNDGVNDVIFSASGESGGMGRRSVICLNGLNGNIIFISPQTSLFLYDVVNTQIGGAVSHSNNGQPYYAQGFNNIGSSTWQYTNPDIIWSMRNIRSINADTVKDIVSQAGFSGRVFALSGESGSLIWERVISPCVNGNVKFFPRTNISSHFEEEFIIASGQRSINKLNPINGNDLWVNGLDNSYILGCDIIGYTNSPVDFDIAAGTLGNNFYILNGRTGQIKFQYSFGNGNTNFAVEKTAMLGQLNSFNGNANEIVVGSRDGRVICFTGGYYTTPNVENNSGNIPDKFSLLQNYPNPFNPVTNLGFGISNLGFVSLKVYDITGKEVAILVNQKLSPGSYEVEFDGSNFSSGIYFYELVTDNFSEVKRMILLK